MEGRADPGGKHVSKEYMSRDSALDELRESGQVGRWLFADCLGASYGADVVLKHVLAGAERHGSDITPV